MPATCEGYREREEKTKRISLKKKDGAYHDIYSNAFASKGTSCTYQSHAHANDTPIEIHAYRH